MAMYVIVPESGGEFLMIPGFIAGSIGAVCGGYHYYTYGGSVIDSAGVAVGIVMVFFQMAGLVIGNLAPSSQTMFVIGWCVRWILGVYFGFYSGIGGFIGAGAVWVMADVLGASHHAH